jgi:hypothetical protein
MTLEGAQQYGQRQVGAIADGAEQTQRIAIAIAPPGRARPKADAIRRQPFPVEELARILLAVGGNVGMPDDIPGRDRVAREDAEAEVARLLAALLFLYLTTRRANL